VDGWTVRRQFVDEAAVFALADTRNVRQYQRTDPRTGRPEVVSQYQAGLKPGEKPAAPTPPAREWWDAPRNWWIPHPDWEKGQQEWITAGEKAWLEKGKANWARGKAQSAAREAQDTARTASEHEHGYERPDPSRHLRERGTYKNPADHPFFKRNQMSPENIVKAYDDTTPAEKEQGGRWYEDGYRLAWALGGGDAAKGAAVLSAYSPRTGWPLNIYNAARSLHTGRALGPGEGVIMGSAQRSAQRILDGEHPDDVLQAPKTNAFGRLLALGHDHPEDTLGQVVVDRHALSVAAGRTLKKEDTEGKGEFASPIAKEPFYGHVADMYREAAKMISERDGEEIAPHQVQAITWLRQQRVNDEATVAAAKAGVKGKNTGLITAMRNHWAQWQAYAREHGLRTELGTTALPPTPITAAEARGNSRPVTAAEFHQVASRGRDLLNSYEDNRSPITGLTSNWQALRDQAWQAVQDSWGGVTIDAHTGELVPDGADKFAVSVKPPGVHTISIPENATEAEFNRAMDLALERFGSLLEGQNFHLGVFRDDEHHRIDFDPVLVVDSQQQAEEIGAYTHNIGGAYRFSDGNGYWPPHIAGQ
jgi:hypothetical protein